MISWIINRYPQYDITFDSETKTLYIRKTILVSDFVNIRNIINSLELNVSNVVVGGWSDSVDYSDTGYI